MCIGCKEDDKCKCVCTGGYPYRSGMITEAGVIYDLCNPLRGGCGHRIDWKILHVEPAPIGGEQRIIKKR